MQIRKQFTVQNWNQTETQLLIKIMGKISQRIDPNQTQTKPKPGGEGRGDWNPWFHPLTGLRHASNTDDGL